MYKVKLNTSSAFCGQCHIRGEKEKIPAAGGYIQHHEQYNELLAGPHKSLDCVVCHNPHKKSEFSIKKDCSACNEKQANAFRGSVHESVGISCVKCHMPKATKSAIIKNKYEADIRTHLFKINIYPKAEMFYKETKLDKEGKPVLDKGGKPEFSEFAKGFVTLNFACLGCHINKDISLASEKAKGIHSYKK